MSISPSRLDLKLIQVPNRREPVMEMVMEAVEAANNDYFFKDTQICRLT